MSQKVLLNSKEVNITLHRLACQLIENHDDFSETVLIGIQPRGKYLADRLAQMLTKDYKIKNNIIDTERLDEYKKRLNDEYMAFKKQEAQEKYGDKYDLDNPLHKSIILEFEKEFGAKNFDDILKDIQNEASGLDEFEIWLNNGIDRGWVTEPFCNTHEGDPYMTEEEEQEWEEGGDPCQVVIKINNN